MYPYYPEAFDHLEMLRREADERRLAREIRRRRRAERRSREP